jgi:hypothetical protein
MNGLGKIARMMMRSNNADTGSRCGTPACDQQVSSVEKYQSPYEHLHDFVDIWNG